MATRTAKAVLRVIRNALAHGSIICLDENGLERCGARLSNLGFLARYEESDAQKAARETYRLVTATAAELVELVKSWASWLNSFPPDTQLPPLPPAGSRRLSRPARPPAAQAGDERSHRHSCFA